MKKNKSVIDIIFAEYNNFYEAEKKIADYIVNNTQKVIDMTISELAESAGASDATVTRFCKKCHMKGFHHLKITLARELVESKKDDVKISGDVSESNIKESLSNILANKVEELKQTVSMIDEKELSEILNLIRNARNVQFAAVGWNKLLPAGDTNRRYQRFCCGIGTAGIHIFVNAPGEFF